LFGGSKDGGSVVSNADCESRIVGETRQPLDAGEIKTQTGGANLHTQPRFGLRFGSERSAAGSRVRAAVDLAGDAELFVYAKDASRAVSDHIVLGEQFSRRRQDRDAQVAEGIKAAIVTKLLADQYRTVRIRLIQTDAARLVRVWQSHTHAQTQRRTAPGLAAQFDFGPENKIAGVVGGISTRRQRQRNG